MAITRCVSQSEKELAQNVLIEEKWTMQEIAMLDQVLVVEKEDYVRDEILHSCKRSDV